MTSFLDPAGLICLRLSISDRSEVLSADGAAVEQYGRNMPDFAGVPPSAADAELDALFVQSWDHAGGLKPKEAGRPIPASRGAALGWVPRPSAVTDEDQGGPRRPQFADRHAPDCVCLIP
jgi:hypothetical protein